MIIQSSAINMTSSHTLLESTQEEEKLRYWKDKPSVQSNTGVPAQNIPGFPVDTLDISTEAKQLSLSGSSESDEYYGLSEEDESKLRTLQAMIEAFTGKKFRFIILRLNKEQLADQETQLKLRSLGVGQGQAQPQRVGWGLQYDYSRTYSEKEQVSFNAGGVVKTADGKEINFSFALNMSREFYSRSEFHLRAGDAAKIDPLVINFDAPAASLTTNKFSFDLDADGNNDNISFVNPGSGFLTLDLNGDGVVNDGKELFGPQSGDGFADLAKYDSDGNNWIDEADPIWDKLRIWTKDAAGNDVLFALGQKGVGAIYLGNISTEFAMKDAANQEQGQLRSSSVFLRENGTAGSIQQIDLVG